MSAPSLLMQAGTSVPACCEDETWKPVPDWPHEASTCGRVRSIDRLEGDGTWRLGGLLPQYPDKRKGKGYLYVVLLDGERRRKVHVAVVVLEAHRGLRPPGREACHNHGIRTDNHLAELRWDTREANIADMLEHREARQRRNAGNVAEAAFPQEGARAAQALQRDARIAAFGTRRLRLPLLFVLVFPSVKTRIQAFRDRKAA